MESDGDEYQFRVETERLILRRPAPEDADRIAALADNWAVAANLATMPHPYARADADLWIARAASATGIAGPCVIELVETGAVIGACGIGATGRDDGSQLGYWLGEPHWRRGYATEAGRAMIDVAFADPALPHLWCSCRVTNEASRRVIQKCGFQYHGAGLMHSAAVDGSVAVEHYCLERALWTGINGWRARPHDSAECRP